MAQERNKQREHQKMVELGQANAELTPRLERWCSSLKVRLTSYGILAEVTRLPIGMMEVNCPHAKNGGIQSMTLQDVAAYFVTKNCRGCSHHKELNPDNAGREILREAEKIETEEKAEKQAASAAMQRVRSLVRSDLTAALKSAPTTEQSVLECVARLEDPQQASDAAALLCQGAELAPEYFNDLACEVMAEHFTDSRSARDCAQALRLIGQKRGKIPDVVLKAAQKCADGEFCYDEVLEILADHYEVGGDLPSVPSVCRIVRHHGYKSVGTISQRPVANPGQVRLLLAIGRRDRDRLVMALKRILEEPNPHIRIAAPVAVLALLDGLSEIGPPLLPKLTSSLSLDDAEHGEPSADVQSCEALAEIFTRYPAETRDAMDTAAQLASTEVQKLLMKPYERLTRVELSDLAPGVSTERHLTALRLAMDALVPVVTDAKRPLEVRESAVDTLSRIAWNHPDLVMTRIDSILGALALVVHEHVEFAEKNPGGDPQLPGYPRLEGIKFGHIQRELRESLEHLVGDYPQQVFDAVTGMLATLNSADKAQERLKTYLVGLLRHLARNVEYGPKVIPPLYQALMDVQSVLVRSEALDVIADIMPRHADLVPENMREMVVIYLRDSYVGIHQGAAKVMEHYIPASATQAEEILVQLTAWYATYLRDQLRRDHLPVLANAIVRICRHYPQYFPKFALPILIKQAQSEDNRAARTALETWHRSPVDTPLLKRIFVRDLLAYFRRFAHEHDDYPDRHDEDSRLLRALAAAGTADLAAHSAAFRAVVVAHGPNSGFRGLHFIAILLQHELYDMAATCADALALAVPSDRRGGWVRDQALLLKAAARAEAALILRNAADALAFFQAEEARLAQFAPKPDANDTKELMDALSMAHKISSRLR